MRQRRRRTTAARRTHADDPNVVALAGFVLLLATIEMQVRMVEEPYLAAVHQDSYRSYTQEVGRFVPGLGLSR